jgi:hypothetical protein
MNNPGDKKEGVRIGSLSVRHFIIEDVYSTINLFLRCRMDQ